MFRLYAGYFEGEAKQEEAGLLAAGRRDCHLSCVAVSLCLSVPLEKRLGPDHKTVIPPLFFLLSDGLFCCSEEQE